MSTFSHIESQVQHMMCYHFTETVTFDADFFGTEEVPAIFPALLGEECFTLEIHSLELGEGKLGFSGTGMVNGSERAVEIQVLCTEEGPSFLIRVQGLEGRPSETGPWWGSLSNGPGSGFAANLGLDPRVFRTHHGPIAMN